jgi:uncharacterized membrane protein
MKKLLYILPLIAGISAGSLLFMKGKKLSQELDFDGSIDLDLSNKIVDILQYLTSGKDAVLKLIVANYGNTTITIDNIKMYVKDLQGNTIGYQTQPVGEFVIGEARNSTLEIPVFLKHLRQLPHLKW